MGEALVVTQEVVSPRWQEHLPGGGNSEAFPEWSPQPENQSISEHRGYNFTAAGKSGEGLLWGRQVTALPEEALRPMTGG